MNTFEERIIDSDGTYFAKDMKDALRHREEVHKRWEKLGIPILDRESVKDLDYFKKRIIGLINKYVKD